MKLSTKTGMWLMCTVAAIGALVRLSHLSGARFLGDFMAAFGGLGGLCMMLAQKLGNHRPQQERQDPQR